MSVKVDDPRDVQSAYDERFNDMTSQPDLQKLEQAGDSGYGSQGDEGSTNDLGEQARQQETTDGGWANNVTGKQSQQQKGWRGAANKARAVFKNKTATTAILALLGIGGSVPFIGSAALPFSIVGNMDAQSMMQGLQEYTEDYIGFNIFDTSKASVGTTADKIKGLRKSEVEQLKRNGVELRDEKINPITRKRTYGLVVFNGKEVRPGAEFKQAMRNDVAFRKAMVYTKGSYWKSSKNAFTAGVKRLFRINPNPILDGADDKARAKQLTNEAINGDTSHSSTSNLSDEIEEGSKEAAERDKATDTIGEIDKEVEAGKKRIADGDITSATGEKSSMADISNSLDRDSVDILGGETKSLGGKIWGYVNATDIGDTLCTVYSVANTANTIARTIALGNIVRFALDIRATIERAKAGDDNGKDVQYLMTMLQNQDPNTGQSFDETSYAAMLFNGKLSSEPSAVSAIGGQSMVALYLGMHALHSVFGSFTSWASGSPTQAGAGRQFLKNVCGLVQNMSFQIATTALSVALSIFSGGTLAIAGGTAKETLKALVDAGLKKTMTDIGKQVIHKLAADESGKLSAKQAAKTVSRKSWSAFKTTLKNMSGWSYVGLVAAGVSTFGMKYIVDTLSGENIAGLTENGFAAFDAVGTGWNQYESSAAIASGGTVANYAQMAAYQSRRDEYRNSYIADMKYDAKDTPFDIKTPYSTLGAALFAAQKTIGISASMSLPSTMFSMFSIPFKLPMVAAAHAADAVTPEAIGEKVADPYLQDRKIATTVTGSPDVIFDKHYTFEDILDKLVDNDDPQIKYEGNDEKTGEPKLSIIPDSKLAKYAEKCHNPERTQVDPEFINDDESNYYDVETCMTDGRNYNQALYPLYADAVRFIGQVTPDAENSAGGDDSADSQPEDSTAGPTGADGESNAGDDLPAEFKSILAKCKAASGGFSCGSPKPGTYRTWLGTFPGQCASFTAWRVAQQWYGSRLKADGSNIAALLRSNPIPGGTNLAFGNGIEQADNLIRRGIATRVDGYKNVQPGDIVSVRSKYTKFGHVFAIKSVNNGKIMLEDYNIAGGDGTGNYGVHPITEFEVYHESSVVAIARVKKGGGE